MSATLLSQIILVFSIIAFVLYAIGFACPNWLKQDFVLKQVFPVTIQNNTMVFDLSVESNMGLLKSCEKKTPLIPGNTKSETDCGSDGAKDWQKISAGLAIAGLVLSGISLVMNTLTVLLSKLKGCKKLRISVVFMNMITVGCMIGAIILYAENKDIQVAPPLPIEITYDISWAFYVFVASCGVYAFLIVINVVDAIWSPGKSAVSITKEPSVAYAHY